MGSRSADQVKQEIVQIRTGLEDKIVELEHRLPPLVKAARRAAVIAAGGGASGSALYLALRIRRRSRTKQKAAEAAAKALVPTSPTVTMLPRGAVVAAVGIAAIWAGVRVYEITARSRQGVEAGEPAELKVLRGADPKASGG